MFCVPSFLVLQPYFISLIIGLTGWHRPSFTMGTNLLRNNPQLFKGTSKLSDANNTFTKSLRYTGISTTFQSSLTNRTGQEWI